MTERQVGRNIDECGEKKEKIQRDKLPNREEFREEKEEIEIAGCREERRKEEGKREGGGG